MDNSMGQGYNALEADDQYNLLIAGYRRSAQMYRLYQLLGSNDDKAIQSRADSGFVDAN